MLKILRNIVVVFVVLAVLGAVSYVWDRSETAYDQKQESALIHNALRVFRESGDKDAIVWSYVGSTKTKTLHTFRSDCALEIRSTDLVGFDSIEDAAKAGYAPCGLCLGR